MWNGRAFRLSDLGEIISDLRFFPVSMHLPGWWKSLLHGINLKAMAGKSSHEDVHWRVVSSPLSFVGETMRPISDEELRRRIKVGMPCGMIEWAHMSMDAPEAEVIIAAIHGHPEGDQVLLYANCLEAPSLFHGFAVQARLTYRGRSNPKPLAPVHVLVDPEQPPVRLGAMNVRTRSPHEVVKVPITPPTMNGGSVAMYHGA